jgi:hypothetical protein
MHRMMAVGEMPRAMVVVDRRPQRPRRALLQPDSRSYRAKRGVWSILYRPYLASGVPASVSGDVMGRNDAGPPTMPVAQLPNFRTLVFVRARVAKATCDEHARLPLKRPPFEMIGIRHAPMESTSRLGAFAKLGARSSRSLRGYSAGRYCSKFPDADQFKAS